MLSCNVVSCNFVSFGSFGHFYTLGLIPHEHTPRLMICTPVSELISLLSNIKAIKVSENDSC